MNIKTFSKTLTGIALGCSISLFASAEVVLVVHPSNSADLNKSLVKRIFLGKEKKFSTGQEAIPINQAPNTASRSSFDTDTLGRSSTQVAAYWSKLVFTGKGIPPKEVNSDAEVITLVAGNQNAVGYVDSNAVNDSVKSISLN
ncbi:MAG: phosphate ABC transporter substrate-binding protein [Paraglaciecola sp.]|nr:phosphate ABC transporter substrate-binding protein [Paraglaciecola sp.]